MTENKPYSKPKFGKDFFDFYYKFDRVKACYEPISKILKDKFLIADALYPITGVFFRAFKDEEILEMWGRAQNGHYVLVEKYKFSAMSGMLGPKRKELDYQIPEGFYFVERYNPVSRHLLSLGLNFPNESDLILNDKSSPGSDIFIHGGNVTIGCIAITDELVKEVFIAAFMAQSNGLQKVHAHIFPARLSDLKLSAMKERFNNDELSNFWQNLKMGYDYFENNKIIPNIKIDKSNGEYYL